LKLSTLFPDHAPSAKVADPLYIGGPEMNGAIFAVVRRDPGQPSIHLFADLFMTGNSGNIDRIIEQSPNDARYFAGFVGWRPGELAAEIAQGFWYVAEPDPAFVFRHDTSGMWEELVKRLGNGHPPQRGRGLQETKLEAGPV
jgi:putative transcriptional regulator